jgi:CheY-like chemotaxis protein
MDINDLVKLLPSIIAETIEDIYLINKNKDESYHIQYEGRKILVEQPEFYNTFINYINDIDPSLINEIETKETVKKFTNNYMIDVITQGEYKIVIINDCNIEEEASSDYKILIADDSNIIINFFTKIFKDRFKILTATNGDEAIKLFEANKDDKLVGCFFDLQMPVKNGYEVLDYFKQNNLFGSYPVSVISGEDSGDTITELTTKYKIVDMLQKPFNNDSVTNIVNKTVSLSPNYKG